MTTPYIRPTGPAPPHVPKDKATTRAIPYGQGPVSLYITVSPWPDGMELFLSNTSWGTQNPPTKIGPGENTTWNGGEVVFVYQDGFRILLGEKVHDMLHEGVEITTPVIVPAISSAAPSSLPLGPSTPTVTGSTVSGDTLTAPSSTATGQKLRSESTSGLGGGAVAGVAIGCLIAGALIAGLVLWLCSRRRKANRGRYSETSAIALIPPDKGALTHTRSLGGGSPPHVSAGAAFPQPLEDQAISGEISKIGNLIKNHVQSYYHSKAVNPGLMDLDDIMALGPNLPVSAGTLSTLLDNSATREMTLRFCIAWAIVHRLQNYGRSSESLLPPELCAPMREISNMGPGNKGDHYSHNLKAAHWRVTTAELMRSTYVQDPFTASDSRNVAILSLAQVLESMLHPFADSRMNNEERKRNLEEILKRSALFAFTIFSQPSSWDFDWKEKQGVKPGEMCIFPALVQVTNEAGERVRPPRSFSEAVIRRLEG